MNQFRILYFFTDKVISVENINFIHAGEHAFKENEYDELREMDEWLQSADNFEIKICSLSSSL